MALWKKPLPVSRATSGPRPLPVGMHHGDLDNTISLGIYREGLDFLRLCSVYSYCDKMRHSTTVNRPTKPG